MDAAHRFSDLGRLFEEDDALIDVAQFSVGMLSALRPEELRRIQEDSSEREAVFARIWDGAVETMEEAPDGLRTWRMAHGGVVADHILHLWVVGGYWPDRVRALLGSAIRESPV